MKDLNKNKEGYKHTRAGWIPEQWNINTIGKVAEIKSGIGFKASEYIKNGVRLLQIENVGYGCVKWENPIMLPKDYLTKYPQLSLNENDIVLALNRPVTNGKLKIATLKKIDTPCILYQRVGKIEIVSEIVTSKYLFYLFKIVIKNHVQSQSVGSDQPFISLKYLYKEPIPIPSIEEQNCISSILSTWDGEIETTENLISAKDQLKKGLMQQLLTGKKRLPGFNGEWKKIGAGEVFKNISIKGNINEQLLSATQDKGIIPRSMLEARVTMPSGELKSFKLVEPGDFVISLRSFQGGLEYSYYKGLVSPAYNVLKPKLKIDEEFYKYYFKSYDFIGHLSIAVIGIRDGKQISYDDFSTVMIPYPDIIEQKAISNILVTLDKEINLLKSQLELFQQQKKGLMQVLLTGAVRVKV